MPVYTVEMVIRKEAHIDVEVEADDVDLAEAIAYGRYEQGELDAAEDEWWDSDCEIVSVYREDEDD